MAGLWRYVQLVCRLNSLQPLAWKIGLLSHNPIPDWHQKTGALSLLRCGLTASLRPCSHLGSAFRSTNISGDAALVHLVDNHFVETLGALNGNENRFIDGSVIFLDLRVINQ